MTGMRDQAETFWIAESDFGNDGICHLTAGLNVESDTILQAAMIVTDGQLKHEVEVPCHLLQYTFGSFCWLRDWTARGANRNITCG